MIVTKFKRVPDPAVDARWVLEQEGVTVHCRAFESEGDWRWEAWAELPGGRMGDIVHGAADGGTQAKLRAKEAAVLLLSESLERSELASRLGGVGTKGTGRNRSPRRSGGTRTKGRN